MDFTFENAMCECRRACDKCINEENEHPTHCLHEDCKKANKRSRKNDDNNIVQDTKKVKAVELPPQKEDIPRLFIALTRTFCGQVPAIIVSEQFFVPWSHAENSVAASLFDDAKRVASVQIDASGGTSKAMVEKGVLTQKDVDLLKWVRNEDMPRDYVYHNENEGAEYPSLDTKSPIRAVLSMSVFC